MNPEAGMEADGWGNSTIEACTDYLDFHWSRSWRYPDYVSVRRRTNRRKFRGSLLALKEWLKRSRHLKLRDLLVVLRRKLQGYWNYYGVIGNSMMTWRYSRAVYSLLYKWLNRRNQSRSMTWGSFARRWPGWEIPAPVVVEKPQ